MTAWVAASSLRWSRLVIASVVAVLILGAGALTAASVDVYPEFSPTAVQVQTEALGLSAAEVESLVTVPLEQDLLNGVPWVDHISSTSAPGLSQIDVVFQAGTDALSARQMVQERMTQIRALPNVGTPPIMVQPRASMSRVAMIGLRSADSSTRGLVDLSYRARWTIKSHLTGVPGVANVILYGQRDRQLQVQVDSVRLKQRGATLADVIATTGNALWVSPLSYLEANTPGTGGYIESANQRLAIQHILPISTAQDLARVALIGDHAGKAHLGDVATVAVDHQPLIGDAITAGQPGMVLVVEKFPGASTREVTQGVEAAMAQLSPGLHGIQVDTRLYRPASYLDAALHHLGLAGLLALVLLTLVIAALSYSWRIPAVVVTSVGVSLLSAAVVLHLRGVTFTSMTLVGFAAALGVVVDAAISDVFALGQRTRKTADGDIPEPADGMVAGAFVQVRGAATYACLILVLLTVPAWFLSPFVSSFSRPLIAAFALALALSIVVALTLTPTLTALLLSGRSAERPRSPVASWVQQRLDRALAENLRRRGFAALGAGVLAISVLALAPQLAAGPVLPELKDPSLLVSLRTLPGTSLLEMDRITGAVSTEVRALPGVSDVGVHVGRAVTSDRSADVNTSEVWVTLAPSADITRTRDAVSAVVTGYAGVRSGLHTYAGNQLSAAIPSVEGTLVVRIYGKDGAELQKAAHRVVTAATAIPGVAIATPERTPAQPAVEVSVKLQAARQAGLAPGDVRRTVTTMMSGLLVGNLYEKQAVFDVVVRGPVDARNSITDLQNILIDTPSGHQARLRDVADVTVRSEPSVIRHEAVARSLDVTVSVRGRDTGSVAGDLATAVGALPMPAESHATVLPVTGAPFGSAWSLAAMAVAALLGAFLLLQAALSSWRLAGMVLVLLPLACAGGLYGAAATGGGAAVGAVAGLVALVGITVRQALTLVQAYRARESARPTGDRRQLVQEVTSERLMPVLVTAVSTAAVLVPGLLWGDQAGLEILRPLSATVLTGLVSVVLVVAGVLPGFYLAVAGRGVASAGAQQGRVDTPPTAPEPSDPQPAPVTTAQKEHTVLRRISWIVPLLLVATLALAACSKGGTSSTPEAEPPVQLTAVGPDLKSVTLTPLAVRRLGIVTAPVRTVVDTSSPPGRLVVPYSAIVYDEKGATWAFVTSAPRTYLRHAVTVDRIDGEAALLTKGPGEGSRVVTTGSEELLGAEYEISGE